MTYWTTADRPAHEQFSYWREVICEAFTPLTAERTAHHRTTSSQERGIASWVESSLLSSTNCAEVSSRTQHIRHGEAEVRRTTHDQVFVNLQLKGHCIGQQDGRTCLVPEGGFALFDTTSRYDLEFVESPDEQEWRVLSFRVPRSDLLPLLADRDGFTAVTHDAGHSGAANLVASTMSSIWRNHQELARPTADAAEIAFTTTLAAGIGGSTEVREGRREVLDAALRASIHRYLATHLRTADLSPAQVARRFAISVRKLHSLYEGTDLSFAQTVMRLRVDACARELASHDATITEIASRWGFCDASHLNRVFRSHRGCLPSEYRLSATAS